MRHYDTDSAQSMARILSLALLADGGIDKSEIDWITQTKVMERLGVEPEVFDEVLQHFYEDVIVGSEYFEATQFRLTTETIDALLNEIADPERQSVMLNIMLDATCADGSLSDGERVLLARAVERWGGGARWPIRLTSPDATALAGAV